MDWQTEGEEVKQQYHDDVYITNARVVKAKESFSVLELESISLAHLSMVSAYKRRRVGLVVAGAVLSVLFMMLYLATLGYSLYTPPVVSTERTVFLGFDVLAVILIILGIFLGPKTVTFKSDSGGEIWFKPANSSEIEEVLQWFGALSNNKALPPA